MLWKKKPQSKAGQEFLIDLETASAQPTPAGVKPFIKKHWKPITAAVCAAAVAAAMLIPKGGAKQASASAQYVETSPEKRNIVNSYSADGTITAADTYTVKPMVKGTVLTADFEVGDTVSKGNVLYTIDSSDMASSVEKAQLSLEQAQSSYDDAVDAQYIRSSVRGTVASLKVKAGDVVTAGQEVAVVRDDSTLLLTLDFPAADAASYSVGQSVDVTIDGTFESTTGTIQSISGADSLSSGNLAVRSVVIAVPNPGTLNTAMSGTASINGVSAMGSAHFTCQYEQDHHRQRQRHGGRPLRERRQLGRRGHCPYPAFQLFPHQTGEVGLQQPAQRRAFSRRQPALHGGLHHHLPHQRHHY